MNALQCLFLIVLVEAKKFIKPRVYEEPDSPIQKKIDVYPAAFNRPVPFGHIYKDGFEDPMSGLKAPIDVLELSMKYPRNPEEETKMAEEAAPERIEYRKMVEPPGFVSPRDKLLKELGIQDNHAPIGNETRFRWYDLVSMHRDNLEKPPSPRMAMQKNFNDRAKDRLQSRVDQEMVFPEESFTATKDISKQKDVNFTTCEEYNSNTYFYPKDVVDFEWVPFYIWSAGRPYYTSIVHKFYYAKKRVVNSYREVYRKSNISINWEHPKMMLKGMTEMLLIAIDRKGLFHSLSLLETPPKQKDILLPYATIRLKVEEPYLVLLHCTEKMAALMAVASHEPATDKDKVSEAQTIKIHGPGNPVTRDLEEELRLRIAEQEKLRQTKDSETIVLNEPIPPMDQF